MMGFKKSGFAGGPGGHQQGAMGHRQFGMKGRTGDFQSRGMAASKLRRSRRGSQYGMGSQEGAPENAPPHLGGMMGK